jgi:hypothetical protein
VGTPFIWGRKDENFLLKLHSTPDEPTRPDQATTMREDALLGRNNRQDVARDHLNVAWRTRHSIQTQQKLKILD